MAREIKKRSNGVETAYQILQCAIEEMDETGPARFNLDRVIERSRISRGSIYHHYGNREGLILAVELHRLQGALLNNDQQARLIMEQIETAKEAFAIIELGIRSAALPAQRVIRLQRVASFAASQHAPAIRDALIRLQLGAEKEFAETLRLARDKGFIDPVEPIEGVANFIQSFLFGRMLIDILDSPEADNSWHEAAMVSIRALLRPKIE